MIRRQNELNGYVIRKSTKVKGFHDLFAPYGTRLTSGTVSDLENIRAVLLGIPVPHPAIVKAV